MAVQAVRRDEVGNGSRLRVNASGCEEEGCEGDRDEALAEHSEAVADGNEECW